MLGLTSSQVVLLSVGLLLLAVSFWDVTLLLASLVIGLHWGLSPLFKAYVSLSSPEATVESYFEDGSGDVSKREPFPLLVADVPDPKQLSVIVPAYKEEQRLTRMLDDTIQYLEERSARQASFTWEIIIVDDGSPDDTYNVALSFSKKHGTDKVRVLKLARNYGKGGAVRKGMLRARGNLLLMADADGATRFSDIERLEEAMLRFDPAQGGLVVGSRAHLIADEKNKRKGLRGFVSQAFQSLFVAMLVPGGVRDTQCGFKLFSRRCARMIFPLQKLDGWAFDCELLFLARVKYKFPVAEVAVDWVDMDGSKLTVANASLEIARDILLMTALYRSGIW